MNLKEIGLVFLKNLVEEMKKHVDVDDEKDNSNLKINMNLNDSKPLVTRKKGCGCGGSKKNIDTSEDLELKKKKDQLLNNLFDK